MKLKRFFDVITALVVLIILAPLLLFLSIVVMLSSKGPIFFRQVRVGKNGRSFVILKFRTMVVNNSGNSISIKGDSRITRVGRWLRKYKLDELPELINVLVSEMSFVGPRPDVPGYADKLIGEDREILNLKPGITGPASLKYINEEDILSLEADPKKYNDEVIFPDKVRINLLYLHNWSLLLDLKIILDTIFRRQYCEKRYFK